MSSFYRFSMSYHTSKHPLQATSISKNRNLSTYKYQVSSVQSKKGTILMLALSEHLVLARQHILCMHWMDQQDYILNPHHKGDHTFACTLTTAACLTAPCTGWTNRNTYHTTKGIIHLLALSQQLLARQPHTMCAQSTPTGTHTTPNSSTLLEAPFADAQSCKKRLQQQCDEMLLCAQLQDRPTT